MGMQFELTVLSGDISWCKWCTKQCSDVGRTMIQRWAHCWQNIENESKMLWYLKSQNCKK
jgi:hypothetical protein